MALTSLIHAKRPWQSAFILLLFAHSGFAQTTDTGTVLGSVDDPSGALVADATIELKDLGTQSIRSANTNEEGRYTFAGVRPGRYSVSARRTGFQQSVIASLLVEVSKTATINFHLSLGETTQQVQVTAAPGAELQVLDSTVGNTVGGDMLMMLPTPKRNVTSLLLLQPGSMPQSGSSGGQIAGARSDQNTFVLDGANITAPESGDSTYFSTGPTSPEGPVPTPVESIQEFKVSTNNQSASFAGAAGAQVVLVTKRGSDTFHGSLYEYFQNSDLNGNAWDRNRLSQARPVTQDNRYGGSLGGYIPKLPKGQRTYFYLNYEGRRFSTVSQVQRLVPTDTLKAGILRFRDAAGNINSYSLGSSSKCGSAGNSACDPRGLGLNPLVSSIWNQYEPAGNDPTRGDGLNTLGFSGPVGLPVSSDFGVVRIDHAITDRWQWSNSYRYYKEIQAQSRQVDIGGLLPGDVKGVPKALASIPRQPRFFVAGLTGQLSSTTTNEFRFGYMREQWSWADAGVIPQVPGAGAALGLGGDTDNSLIPMNETVTNTRTRAWNSHHWNWSDNISSLKHNHLLQFGGLVNRTTVRFRRDDAQLSQLQPIYLITQTQGLNMPANYRPPACSGTVTTACLPASQVTNWNNLYAQVLGLVDSAAEMRTRSADLTLNPEGIGSLTDTHYTLYSLYFNDSWQIKPGLTFSYGLNWGVTMPPVEQSGKFSIAVDSSNKVIDPSQYLQMRQQAALQGQIYNPSISFDPVKASGLQYPFGPTWNSFAPRLSLAWNPAFQDGWKGRLLGKNKTVIRMGYARVYDRLNGVQEVIDPQQGLGFTVNLQCLGPSRTGACLGNSGVDPLTGFRVGTDGSTVSLPYISPSATPPLTPGVTGFPGANMATVPSSYHLDPHYRPAANDEYDFTIQRELPGNSILEVGYIGRMARNLYSGVQLNQPPFFMVYGGQSFATAFDNVAGQLKSGVAVTPQPFFESALAGSSLCARPAASCTAGVASKFGGNFSSQQVLNLWNGIQPSFVFGPATATTNQLSSFFYYGSQGISNYNAGFISFRQRNWRGLTWNANLTYGHSLDQNGRNQASDNAFSNSYNPGYDYGTSIFDRKFVFNALGLYELPFGKGTSFVDKLMQGWSISPILSIYSGLPLKVADGSGQEFAQLTANAAQAILTQPDTFGNTIHSGITGNSVTGVATADNPSSGGSGLNIFSDPSAVYSAFRPVLISQDTTSGGGGRLRGLSNWNIDLTLARKFRITERMSIDFTAQAFNLINHVQFADPTLSLQSPQTFGVITTQLNNPRSILLGLHLDF